MHEFDVVFDKAGILEFAQLPGVPEPGGDARFGFGLEVGILAAAMQVRAALLHESVQTAQLIERLAVNAFTLGGRLLGELAVVAGEELGVLMQGGLSARKIRVAELFRLLLHFAGELGVHVADAEADKVARQSFQDIDAVELGLDFLGEGGLVDLLRLGGVGLLLLDARLQLGAFLLDRKSVV